MTLISLAQAKQHLRVTSDDENADIWSKAQLASDIIVAYLKGRPIAVSTLTNSGGLATVTAATVHGLTTGDTVFIRGAVQPEYNGEVVVTVTGTNTFTYPIAGTPVTATGIMWIRAAATWTETTVPSNVKAAILVMLTHYYEHRGDDMDKYDESAWQAVRNLLVGFRDPALA
jgi:hypothetical protein